MPLRQRFMDPEGLMGWYLSPQNQENRANPVFKWIFHMAYRPALADTMSSIGMNGLNMPLRNVTIPGYYRAEILPIRIQYEQSPTIGSIPYGLLTLHRFRTTTGKIL